MEKTWKELHLEFLKLFYEENAEKWRDQHDDRRVYSNTYYMLVEAIKSLDDEPNNFVKVAMNHHMNDELAMIDRINHFFENRG